MERSNGWEERASWVLSGYEERMVNRAMLREVKTLVLVAPKKRQAERVSSVPPAGE